MGGIERYPSLVGREPRGWSLLFIVCLVYSPLGCNFPAQLRAGSELLEQWLVAVLCSSPASQPAHSLVYAPLPPPPPSPFPPLSGEREGGERGGGGRGDCLW